MLLNAFSHRQISAWLLTPALFVSIMGGQICWCPEGDGHHHGGGGGHAGSSGHESGEHVEEHADVDEQPHDDGHAGEHGGGHDHPPAGDASHDDCECAGAAWPADAAAKSIVEKYNLLTLALAPNEEPFVIFQEAGLAWSCTPGHSEARSPPIFLMHCSFLC